MCWRNIYLGVVVTHPQGWVRSGRSVLLGCWTLYRWSLNRNLPPIQQTERAFAPEENHPLFCFHLKRKGQGLHFNWRKNILLTNITIHGNIHPRVFCGKTPYRNQKYVVSVCLCNTYNKAIICFTVSRLLFFKSLFLICRDSWNMHAWNKSYHSSDIYIGQRRV